ncbi:MAG: thioesterase [Robiginitomaculum sp.]|nr:MAG: thioesterase [Robiginitomaculum sp.]
MSEKKINLESINAIGQGKLPGYLGIEVTEVENKTISAILDIKPHHLAPNGYLHAGTVVTLADSCAGYGCVANLPKGASGFTTVELKSNHLGTALDGRISCIATLVHGGRTTQVWDSIVTNDTTGKTIALFRCTQMILYPRA